MAAEDWTHGQIAIFLQILTLEAQIAAEGCTRDGIVIFRQFLTLEARIAAENSQRDREREREIKKKIPASDPKQCVGGQQQKILYVSLPIRGAATHRRKIVYKTYVCVFCTLRISSSSAGVMSPIHVVASTNMDPLQDPDLRIHVSTSLCLRLLCKIHVAGFMSQHPCVSQDPLQDPCCRIHSSAAICFSGSTTRSTSSDSCLSIFVSHGFSARSTSPDSCLSIFISQDPLQDPCLRIHVSHSCLSIHQYGSSARSMSPDSCLRIFVSQDSLKDPCLRIHVSASTTGPLQNPRLRIHVSASLYLRLLCKIHVSGSVYKHPYVSQDPLQDPCFRIHASASICISGPSAKSMSPIHVSASLYLRVLCKIHVSGFMSQHLYISGSSARSMSPDPYISIHMYLRILCKIHASRLMSQHLCISGSSKRSMSSGSCLSIFVSQDPLQSPCVIHVSGFMSQHLYIPGSSARSMSPDPCVPFMS